MKKIIIESETTINLCDINVQADGNPLIFVVRKGSWPKIEGMVIYRKEGYTVQTGCDMIWAGYEEKIEDLINKNPAFSFYTQQ